jgi:aldehyde dehydrogenase (NAD+)
MHGNLIGGAWVDGADVARNVNPSNTADLVGEYARADRAQAEQAVAAAAEAFPAWSRTTIAQRAEVLDRAGAEILARAEELGTLLSREEGKTLPEGIGEATRAGQIFRFYAGEALRLSGDRLDS